MQYILLNLAVAMQASTGVDLARTQHHHPRHIRPGYAATQFSVVQVHPGVSARENAWMDYVSRPSPGL